MKILGALLIMICLYSANQRQLKDDYVAHVFIDNRKAADYSVKDGRINKAVYFGVGKLARGEINYSYNKSNELVNVRFKGQQEITGSNEELEKKLYKDEIIQRQLLNDKLKIHIPLQTVNSNELRDISYLFSSGLKYTDTSHGLYRDILIDNINKRFRFYPSDIEDFITSSNLIKNYKISLKQDTVLKEEILFDKGLLTRTYIWINNKTLIVRISCKYPGDVTQLFVKKIIVN